MLFFFIFSTISNQIKKKYDEISVCLTFLYRYLRVYHEISQWVNFPTEFSKNDMIISFFNIFPVNGKLSQKSQCVSHTFCISVSLKTSQIRFFEKYCFVGPVPQLNIPALSLPSTECDFFMVFVVSFNDEKKHFLRKLSSKTIFIKFWYTFQFVKDYWVQM